jgi:hypothetical protein
MIENQLVNDFEPFTYFRASQLPVSFDAGAVFFARIDPSIANTEELLKSLYYQLWFPGYFGFNWNALYDCLCDFHWIEQRKIVIQHESLPNIPEADLKIYLEILRDSVADWSDHDMHQLEVIFNERDRGRVNNIMSSS